MIHAELFGAFFPFIYVLMPGKTKPTYLQIFVALMDLFRGRWNPKRFLVDFEKAVIDVIDQVFNTMRQDQPNFDPTNFVRCKVCGCFFHFKVGIKFILE